LWRLAGGALTTGKTSTGVVFSPCCDEEAGSRRRSPMTGMEGRGEREEKVEVREKR